MDAGWGGCQGGCGSVMAQCFHGNPRLCIHHVDTAVGPSSGLAIDSSGQAPRPSEPDAATQSDRRLDMNCSRICSQSVLNSRPYYTESRLILPLNFSIRNEQREQTRFAG